jgi:hypothetical protein
MRLWTGFNWVRQDRGGYNPIGHLPQFRCEKSQHNWAGTGSMLSVLFRTSSLCLLGNANSLQCFRDVQSCCLFFGSTQLPVATSEEYEVPNRAFTGLGISGGLLWHCNEPSN